MLDWILKIVDHPTLRWILAPAVLLIGLTIAGILSRIAGRILRRKGSHAESLGRKLVFYGLFLLSVLLSLDLLHVPMATMLTAAGVFGIALSFAAQTSVSNLISGVFLIFEGAFRIGDSLKIGDLMGTVLAIDLLSVKIRTFDNQYVRVPNESLIKTNVINLTKYEIRRVDIRVSIAYAESVTRATGILKEVLRDHEGVLRKPDPEILVDVLGDSGVELLVRTWVERVNLLQAKSAVTTAIKAALDEAGIEIPFPHLKVFADEDVLSAVSGTPS